MLKDLKNSIKKILIAHSSNDNYGASKILISILNIIIKQGYEVHLFLPNDGPLNDNKIVRSTKVKIVKMGVFRRKYFNFFGLLNRLFYIFKSSFYIKNYIIKNNIDLVYVNTSTLISPLIASKISAKNNLVHIHEIPYNSKFYSKFLVSFLNIFALDIISVSKSVTEFWIEKGINKHKINTINNGFVFKNPNPKNLNKEKIIFSSVSRIIPYKGHRLLIELFENLCKKNNKIYLQIVGDTLPQYQKYFDNLKLQVQSKGLSDKITFTGFRNDTNFILNKSNFFIHTPISPDPFPTVIFEAVESKTPVITNNLGGAYEILNNGKYGLIIKNELFEESVNKILSFLVSKKQQNENVEKAYDYVCKNFSFELFKSKILKKIE